jgi:hypothetical protein
MGFIHRYSPRRPQARQRLSPSLRSFLRSTTITMRLIIKLIGETMLSSLLINKNYLWLVTSFSPSINRGRRLEARRPMLHRTQCSCWLERRLLQAMLQRFIQHSLTLKLIHQNYLEREGEGSESRVKS